MHYLIDDPGLAHNTCNSLSLHKKHSVIIKKKKRFLFFLDISRCPADGPTRPYLRMYPRTVQAGRKRSFNSSWYTHFPWLEYSTSQDSAYCFACRHFSLPNTPETPFAAKGGYSNWKKAMYKDGGFKWHEQSEGHVNAMFAWSEFKKNIIKDSSIREALDKAYKKKKLKKTGCT